MNIAIITNSTYGGYGYSIVGKNVCKGLRDKGYNCIIFGMQTIARTIKDEYGNINIPFRYDPFGSDSLGNYINCYNINLIIGIFDKWLDQWNYLIPLIKQFNIPYIQHITINSEPISPYLHSKVVDANMIVCPSKWNLKLIQNVGLGDKSIWIPHGVDTDIYKPIDEDEKNKLKEKMNLKDKFVFLSIQRHKGLQKNFPALFYSYNIFLQNVPDAKKNTRMLILTDPTEPEGMMNLLHLRERLGLQEYVKFVKTKPTSDCEGLEIASEEDQKAFYHHANFKLDEYEMRKVYGLSDCFVNSSSGESFCLPVLESFAMGLPVVAPNFGAVVELVNESKAGLLAKIKMMYTTPLISDIAYVDEINLAELMNTIYINKKLREEMRENGIKYAQQYDWKTKIVPMWIELLKIFGG